jgi:hypothetical protein
MSSWFEIVTHRSIIPQDLSPDSSNQAHNLAMDAANRMVRIVEELLERSRILHAPIHIVPALFAAMGMQAVDICSGSALKGRIGVVKTNLAMIALQELQETWPVSGWIFHLFRKIVRRIRNADEFLPNEPVNASPVQSKERFQENIVPVNGMPFPQQSYMDGKPQFQNPNMAPMYAMPNQATSRYLFPGTPNLAMPMQYMPDWAFQNESGWAELDYDFIT